MQTVDINLTGPSDTKRSRFISSQKTYNFYCEKQDETGELSDYVLHTFPGYTLFGSSAGTAARGIYEHDGILYRVVDTTLYSVDLYGLETALATVPGNGRCTFIPMKTNLVVVTTDHNAYFYNVATATIAQITDPNIGNPNGGAFINNQIVFDDGTGDEFVTTDVGDATTINGLNYASAESNSDPLVIPYVFKQKVYMMGTKTIERWWNSGSGNPPFDREEGAILPIGLAAQFSAADNDNALYFLSDDRRVYAISEAGYQVVSSIALSHAIEKYKVISDAEGFCFTMEGQNFYLLTFPHDDETWLYSESAKDWTNLSSGVKGGRYIANGYAFAYQKHIISSHTSGDLYELNVKYFDANGGVVKRVRETGDINGSVLGFPGKDIEMGKFGIVMEVGTGLITGQGSNPKIILEMSDDGGRSWSTEDWSYFGKLGDNQVVVEWHAMGRFTNRRFRLTVSDPVQVTIARAYADVAPCI